MVCPRETSSRVDRCLLPQAGFSMHTSCALAVLDYYPWYKSAFIRSNSVSSNSFMEIKCQNQTTGKNSNVKVTERPQNYPVIKMQLSSLMTFIYLEGCTTCLYILTILQGCLKPFHSGQAITKNKNMKFLESYHYHVSM